MATPRVLVLRAPGTNCDVETAYAFERAGAAADRWHINRLLADEQRLNDYQVLCIPGGFSYGDDVAAGRILGNQIRHHLAERMQEFRAAGKLILGICNGFQVLVKSGLFADEKTANTDTAAPPFTLAWNDSGRFEARWVQLAVQGNKCVFFQGVERMYLPIAHAEGKFVPRDAETLAALEQSGQLALRYAPFDGSDRPPEFPENPNGSVADVAGMCDSTGRVCGLMPHPERHIDPTQHPRWTRGEAGAEGDGLAVFKNATAYFR